MSSSLRITCPASSVHECTNAHIHTSVYVRVHRQTGACTRAEGHTNLYHLESSMERSFEALPASTRDAWSSTRWPTCVKMSHVRIFLGDALQVSVKSKKHTESRTCSRCWKRWALTESGTPSFSRIAITNGFRGCPGAVKALVSCVLSQWVSGSHSNKNRSWRAYMPSLWRLHAWVGEGGAALVAYRSVEV